MAKKQQKLVAVLLAFMGHGTTQYQWNKLRAIRKWVRQWQAPNADADDIERQIVEQIDEWHGPAEAHDEAKLDDPKNPFGGLWDKEALKEHARTFREREISQHLELSYQFGSLPREVTEAVFASWEGILAKTIRTEDALQTLEEQVCAFFKGMDDRTRYILTALERLRFLGSFTQVDYFDEIGNQFHKDVDFLEAKSQDLMNDPQLACLVKAVNLGAVLYAIEDEQDSLKDMVTRMAKDRPEPA
jgi:hypothetical protein